MTGYRTIAANLVAALSLLLALVGVDFGQVLSEEGIDLPALTDQVAGAINMLVALASVVAGIVYRVKARTRVGSDIPLVPPGRLNLHPGVVVLGWIAAVVVAGYLAGCGALIERDTTGMSAQQRAQASVSEAIATTQVSITQTRAAALDLLRQRQIDPDTAERINRSLDEARGAVDAARVLMRAALPDTAQARTHLGVAADAVRAARSLLPTRTP